MHADADGGQDSTLQTQHGPRLDNLPGLCSPYPRILPHPTVPFISSVTLDAARMIIFCWTVQNSQKIVAEILVPANPPVCPFPPLPSLPHAWSDAPSVARYRRDQPLARRKIHSFSRRVRRKLHFSRFQRTDSKSRKRRFSLDLFRSLLSVGEDLWKGFQ